VVGLAIEQLALAMTAFAFTGVDVVHLIKMCNLHLPPTALTPFSWCPTPTVHSYLSRSSLKTQRALPPND